MCFMNFLTVDFDGTYLHNVLSFAAVFNFQWDCFLDTKKKHKENYLMSLDVSMVKRRLLGHMYGWVLISISITDLIHKVPI